MIYDIYLMEGCSEMGTFFGLVAMVELNQFGKFGVECLCRTC